jgi:hypothetical protein
VKEEATAAGKQLQEQLEIRREKLKALLRRVLHMAADHPDLRQAIRDLFAIAETYKEKAEAIARALVTEVKNVGEKAAQVASQIAEQAVEKMEPQAVEVAAELGQGAAGEHATKALHLAEEIFAHLAPGETLEKLRDRLRAAMDSVFKDERMASYFTSLKDLVEDALKNPAQIDSQEYSERVHKLSESARKLFHEKDKQLRPLFKEISDLLDRLVDALTNDEHLKDFQKAISSLGADLITKDSEGRIHLNEKALDEIKKMVGPLIAEQLRLVPLPRIEHHDSNYDLVLDEVVVNTVDIPTDGLETHLENHFAFDLKHMKTVRTHGQLSIRLRNLVVRADNIKFMFRRLTVPRLVDEGHADLYSKGDGVTIVLTFEQQSTAPYLSRAHAHCHIDDLGITIKGDADHQVLLGMLTTFYKNDISKALVTAVESALEKSGNYMAGSFNRAVEMWTEKVSAVL